MYGKLATTCFRYQVYHHIFECYPLGGNRAGAMSHLTAPALIQNAMPYSDSQTG
jgi:hypothetical protein